jgi:DNA-binding MarR family transcriptional regulator
MAGQTPSTLLRLPQAACNELPRLARDEIGACEGTTRIIFSKSTVARICAIILTNQLNKISKNFLSTKIKISYMEGERLSSSSQEKRAEVLGELAREFRQFQGLGASWVRVAAARIGMTATDMQVIDLLASTGPLTAGQLADLTGLTTGAITGMINRLEEAGHVRRAHDPSDGRKVIVQLVPGRDDMREIEPIFASFGAAWDDIVSRYDNEQLVFLLEFLKRSNAMSRQEIVRLREAPSGEEGAFSAPLGELESGRLIISTGISRLHVHADEAMNELYRARFEGPPPDVKTKEGIVTIRYPRHLGILDWRQCAADVMLSVAVPWGIVIKGGASEITADLGKINLSGLEVKGGLSTIRLELPIPEGVVPIRISGGASEVNVRRPAGVAARVHLKGWASELAFDGQSFSGMGNNVWLQSPDYAPPAPCYEIEVSNSASMVTITTFE